MYECLIKKYNDDGSISYEYYTNEYDAIPKAPHIKIPEGAEYFICHEGCYNKELIFSKNNFEDVWSITYNQTQWINSDWDDVGDRLEYMKEHHGSVVLWKREEEMKDKYPDDVIAVTESKSAILWWYDNGMVSKPNDYLFNPWHSTYKQYLTDVPHTKLIYKREDKTMENEVMNEDDYLLTKLQACDVLLIEPEILQWESVDGSWFNIDWNSFHVQNLILDKESKYKLRIKPSLVHVPIEFSEVMDMLADGKVNEVFINKEVNLAQAENPLFYLQYQYHDKYSRVVEKHITYDQWKNSVDLKTSLK